MLCDITSYHHDISQLTEYHILTDHRQSKSINTPLQLQVIPRSGRKSQVCGGLLSVSQWREGGGRDTCLARPGPGDTKGQDNIMRE